MPTRVRVVDWGGPRQGDETRVTLSGIPQEKRAQFEGMIQGHFWMMVENGNLVFSPAAEPLPDPVKDAEMLPFWRQHDQSQEVQGRLQETILDPEERRGSPSFMVKNLCGYHYTAEGYRMNAKLLESYGFVCMRSQREADGKFWEAWYLPGAWAARGPLEVVVLRRKAESIQERGSLARQQEETSAVISFLCSNVSFGSLDVTVQRAAATVD
ncbi:MAG: hypothetical protein WD850_02790 [Candidatus Spechtbacterales bacterium]